MSMTQNPPPNLLLEDETSLKESGDARTLFKQAFEALRVHKNPIDLTMTFAGSQEAQFAQREWSCNRSSFEKFLKSSNEAYTYNDVSLSVLTMLEAAFVTSSQIHILKIGKSKLFTIRKKDATRGSRRE
jgi:hypothetical protein